MEHTLFLKWLVVNCLVAVAALAGVIGTLHLITSAESRVAAVVIVLAYAAASAYAGKLCWRVDKGTYVERDIEHLAYAADKLPWLGLIGTMVGVLMLFLAAKGTTDPHQLAKHVTDGLGTVFVPSIIGAVGSLLLDTYRHGIEHATGTETHEVT